jgi:hypothetical protein
MRSTVGRSVGRLSQRLLFVVVALLGLAIAALTTAAPSSRAATAKPSFTGFGASVYQNGASWSSAVSRSDAKYGHMDVVRVFYPGAPAPWPGPAGSVNRPVVVSFHIPPSQILNGSHDAQLTQWFKTAPTNRTIWWTYYHEPENDIQRHSFTAAQYRAAWKHVAALAAKARHPNLRATLILMCYTLNRFSHRNFANYYPGSSVIDVLGWDCYNKSADGPYESPSRMFDTMIKFSRAHGKPFGVAEYGSTVMKGNTAGRAAWIKAVGAYLHKNGAQFATYFDSPMGPGGDYRLSDSQSATALRSLVTSN